ncbi:hypothetical protein [Mariniphaga sediminis]|nr:hypothetical protein [Mariniphaga sediminis]
MNSHTKVYGRFYYGHKLKAKGAFMPAGQGIENIFDWSLSRLDTIK